MPVSPPNRPAARWRRALSGLTPQVVAIVAAVTLARILARPIPLDAAGWDFGSLITNSLSAFFQLLLIAVPMVIAILATSNLGPQDGIRRVGALALAIVASALVGVVLRFTVPNALLGIGPTLEHAPSLLRTVWPRYVWLGALFAIALEFHRREIASIAATQQAKFDRVALERQMTESRLHVLQAQIEPHFLFNTLANVRRLYSTAPASGAAMLDNLMRYFDIALPRMRRGVATLRDEVELLEAYLRIQQMRMGRRLTFAIDMPGALGAQPVPPMMLLTLAENAVKHGISPALDGGAIRIGARIEDGRLVLVVADSGVGFAPGSGGGCGLANIRARLAAQFGSRASLTLENNELGGVTATIRMPVQEQPAMSSGSEVVAA